MKRFECKSIGMACEFRAEGQTSEEVLAKAEEHAAAAHNLPRGAETRAKIAPQIKDV
ncbi:MAG: DUF1059 domain-containing protein [Candidatus Micrarchaeota archaeon]|nr:DUF1059 domain-containing protein [Candidatus Micrarchaeota archaeon]